MDEAPVTSPRKGLDTGILTTIMLVFRGQRSEPGQDQRCSTKGCPITESSPKQASHYNSLRIAKQQNVCVINNWLSS